MKRLLPFHPVPSDGESHRGYLLNVACGNGYPSTNWLQHVPGFRHYMTHGPGRTLPGVKASWAISLHENEEAPFFCIPAFTQVTEARFCPYCLNDGGFWRVEWEWTYYTACHRHGVQLQSVCSTCGTFQTSNRQQLLKCACGSTLSQQVPDVADSAEIDISTEIFQLQQGLPSANLALRIQVLIGKRDSDYVSRLIRVIGRHAASWEQQIAPAKNSVPSLLTARDHVRYTAKILHDWPKNFTDFLLSYGCLEGAVPGSYRRPSKFSALLRSLPWTWTDATTPIAQVMTDFLERYEPRALDRRQCERSPAKKAASRFVHLTVVARQLRVAAKRLEELIICGEITAYRKEGGKREFILIPNHEITRADALLGDAISHKAAAGLLGISRLRLSQLRREGFILKRNGSAGTPEDRYSVRDLRILLENFRRKPNHCRRDELQTMGHICRFTAGSEREFIELIRALIDGCLRIYGHEEKFGSIGGLLLSKAELQDWRLGLSASRGGLSVVDAAVHLGVKQEVAYHLVRKGFIKSSMTRSGRRMCRLLGSKDIDLFKQTYISAVDIAILHDTSPKAAVANLFQNQIAPVTGPKIDGCRQYFYKKSDVKWALTPGPAVDETRWSRQSCPNL